MPVCFDTHCNTIINMGNKAVYGMHNPPKHKQLHILCCDVYRKNSTNISVVMVSLEDLSVVSG